MHSPRRILLASLLLAAAAALTIPLAAPASPTTITQDDDTTKLLAQLDENVKLHRLVADRANSLYEAGRISKRDLAETRVAALEAELLPLTVRNDPDALLAHLRELVTLRESILRSVTPEELDSIRAPASQSLAEARLRLWQATHPQN